MLVSVITICFNSEAVIRKTIESVLNQTWDKLEYLIVDGASKDRTVAIAEEYSERFAAKGVDYRIYSEPDRGIYDAMNKGIRLSSGDLVGLINSGDWYEPDAVETAVKAYEMASVFSGNSAIKDLLCVSEKPRKKMEICLDEDKPLTNAL